MHIDHLVPLAEAWESGARLWDTEQREAFANDPAGLVAVSRRSNTAKGASDPADWLPPHQAVRCTYAAVWIEVKAARNLTADQAEFDTLAALATDCNVFSFQLTSGGRPTLPAVSPPCFRLKH